MEIPTREEYENEIQRLSGLITQAQEKANYYENDKQKNFKSRCAGMDSYCGGESCCDRWKRQQAEDRDILIRDWLQKKENYKQQLWNYQKDVAKAEQDAQIKAVRQAIADQVRLEQERIQQSQQNQIIMQQAPPAEPPSEPSEIIEPGKSAAHSQILESDFKLPFHENYLIPIIAIGGYLVLRNN